MRISKRALLVGTAAATCLAVLTFAAAQAVDAPDGSIGAAAVRGGQQVAKLAAPAMLPR